MRILGIDPGSRVTGFGIIDVNGDQATLVRHGVIRTGAGEFTERLGVKFGSFVHPVRAALTGTDKGPGLFDVVFLLGKDASVRRLRRAAE